jgi:predicted MFS family arabinose efflux permease
LSQGRDEAPSSAAAEHAPVSKAAWYALAILTCTYLANNIDRSIMSILAEPVRKEFHLNDSELGVLTGLSLSLSFALAGLPIGMLIDRMNRRNLLAVLMTVWSACTAVCGFAQNYWALVWARFAVGAAEAGASPAAMSIIGDLFPKRRRSLAISIFWMSTAAGTAISFIFGAYVAVEFGWRMAFLIAGAPGLVLAGLMVLTLREPRRGALDRARTDSEATPSLAETWREVARRPMVIHAVIAITLCSVMTSGTLVWTSSYLVRVQGMDLKHAGTVIGVSVAVFGALGSIFGGLIGDFAYRRGGLAALPLPPMLTTLATSAFAVCFAISPTPAAAITAFVFYEFFSRGYTASSFNFVLTTMPPRMRGVTTAATSIGSNLGYGLGPVVAGVVSDLVGGSNSLRYGLITLATMGLWVALHFFLAFRSAQRFEAMAAVPAG